MPDKTYLLLAGILLLVFGASSLIKRRKGRVVIKDKTAFGPGVVYRFNADDLLWLARAILGEAGTDRLGGAAVAWTLLNNFMLVLGSSGRRPRFATLAECARSYSTVLSPRWASPDAPGCREHPENCTQAHLRRRREITSKPWEEIPPNIRELVMLWADGRIANPIGASVDWASHGFDGAQQMIGGNYFGTLPFRKIV